jgi:hypothetical protein
VGDLLQPVIKAQKFEIWNLTRTSSSFTTRWLLTLACGHRVSRPMRGRVPPKRAKCDQCKEERHG